MTHDEHVVRVIREADAFVASSYLGSGKYRTIELGTLEAARIAAASIYIDRPVMLYAVSRGRQVHVENYEPKRK